MGRLAYVNALRPSVLGSSAASAVRVSQERYADRVVFKSVGTNPGVYAALSVPEAGVLRNISVKIDGVTAAGGDLFVTAVDPSLSYDGAFLGVIAEDIPFKTVGTPMFRLTNTHGCPYNTVTMTAGTLYLLLVGSSVANNTAADVLVVIESE